MSIKDCRISFLFTKLYIPGFDQENCIINIQYEVENHRVKYPMRNPYTIPLYEIFEREQNTIFLTILVQDGKKYRKIARGEIHIYKKYLFSEKLETEKFVHLELFKNQIESLTLGNKILSAVSGVGKIFMIAKFLDPIVHENEETKIDTIEAFYQESINNKMTEMLRNIIKQYQMSVEKPKQGAYGERFKSMIGKQNEFLKNIRTKNRKGDEFEEEVPLENRGFNDGLSDVSISVVEPLDSETVKIVDINKEMDEFIKNIKVIFDEKFADVLPTNNEELKIYINKIIKQIQLLSDGYVHNIEQMQEINSKIRYQARIYFEKFRDKKNDFKKERKELNKKTMAFEMELTDNANDIKSIKEKFEDFRGEMSYLKTKIGISQSDHKGKYLVNLR